VRKGAGEGARQGCPYPRGVGDKGRQGELKKRSIDEISVTGFGEKAQRGGLIRGKKRKFAEWGPD